MMGTIWGIKGFQTSSSGTGASRQEWGHKEASIFTHL